MNGERLRELVARLASEPALAAELAADPRAFAARHGLGDTEAIALAALRVGDDDGPTRLSDRLSRSGVLFGGVLSSLADAAEAMPGPPETPPDPAPAHPGRSLLGEPGPPPNAEPGFGSFDVAPPARTSATMAFTSERDGFVTTLSPTPDGLHRLVERDAAGRVLGERALRADGRGGWTDPDGRSIYPAGTAPLPMPPSDDPVTTSSTAAEGAVAEYADGTVVRNRPDGSLLIDFSDGRRVERLSSGVSLLREPGGEQLTLYPDGTTLGVDAAGVTMHRFPDGASVLTYPDHSTVATDSDGSTESWTPAPDGTVHVVARDPRGATVAEHHLTVTAGGAFPIEPDLRPAVRAGLPAAPSGPPERVTVEDRSVTREYPDGTTVISSPDGRVSTRYPDGGRAELSTDGTLEYRAANGPSTGPVE